VRFLRYIGIMLTTMGVVLLIYIVFTYKTSVNVVDVGAVRISRESQTVSSNSTALVGVATFATGIVLIFASSKKQ
jgi:uncharacterized membrane protein